MSDLSRYFSQKDTYSSLNFSPARKTFKSKKRVLFDQDIIHNRNLQKAFISSSAYNHRESQYVESREEQQKYT